MNSVNFRDKFTSHFYFLLFGDKWYLFVPFDVVFHGSNWCFIKEEIRVFYSVLSLMLFGSHSHCSNYCQFLCDRLINCS